MANMILAGALRGLGRAGMSIGQQYPGYKQGQRQLLKEEEQEQFLRDFKNREFEFEMDRRRQNAELRAMDMRNRATDRSATAEHRAGLLGQSTLRTENQVASNRAAEEYRANQLALDRERFDFNKGAGATLAGTTANANEAARIKALSGLLSQTGTREEISPEGFAIDIEEPLYSAPAARARVDSAFGRVTPPQGGGGGQLLQTTAPGDDTGVLQTGGQREALTQMQAMGAESYDDVFQWSRSNPQKSDGTPYSPKEIEEFLMLAGIAFGRTR